MWHLYNLVAVGDSIKSTTIRKVKDESATGSSTASRIRTTLTISVENIEFDTSACELRVKGRNIQENQYVKVRYIRTCQCEGFLTWFVGFCEGYVVSIIMLVDLAELFKCTISNSVTSIYVFCSRRAIPSAKM